MLTLIVSLVCIVGRESPQAFIYFVCTTRHLKDVTFFSPLVIGLTQTYNTESDYNIVRQSHQILTDNVLNPLMCYFSRPYELGSIFKMRCSLSSRSPRVLTHIVTPGKILKLECPGVRYKETAIVISYRRPTLRTCRSLHRTTALRKQC